MGVVCFRDMLYLRRWHIAVIVYLFIVLLLLAFRPALLFKADKTAKIWAGRIDPNHSVFSPAFVFPLLGMLSFFLTAVAELAFGI